MAMSINKVSLLGYLGADPTIKLLNNGTKVAILNIATSDSWYDKNEETKKESTEWHRVVIYNDALARVCEDNLLKGSRVYVEGKLKVKKWVDQHKIDRYMPEIVLNTYNGEFIIISSKKNSDEIATNKNTTTPEKTQGINVIVDDEIPF